MTDIHTSGGPSLTSQVASGPPPGWRRVWCCIAPVVVVSNLALGCGLDFSDIADDDDSTFQTGGADDGGDADDAAVDADDESHDGSGSTIPAEAEPVEIIRVVDGDSLEVERDGRTVDIRLIGYNAPELYVDNADGSDRQTCSGLAARDGVEIFVEEVAPILLIDEGTDRYGRTLGDLVLYGEPLVPQLISLGLGLATGDSESNRALMKATARAEIGIWSAECGAPASEQLQIGEVQIDAPGNDRFNLDKEWVELVNTGSKAMELDGWTLRDDTTGHRFPLSGLLAPGATLTVRSGSGASSGTDAGDRTVYLGERFPVWSNAQETVIVVDPNGVFADWRFYEDGRESSP